MREPEHFTRERISIRSGIEPLSLEFARNRATSINARPIDAVIEPVLDLSASLDASQKHDTFPMRLVEALALTAARAGC